MDSLDDTIVAIASPPGGSPRGIVRLSGPESLACASRCFQPAADRDLGGVRTPMAIRGAVVLSGLNRTLPADMFFWPTGRSYTGQPVVEFHTIGSPPLLEGLQRALCEAGARLAGPGEFTLRAFLSGRIDLTQAEAVLGVIDAADGRELDVALTQLAGGMATPLHTLRDQLLDLLAHLEAGLDFAEEDIAFITREELSEQLRDAESRVAVLVSQMASRGESGAVANAAIVGRPNAGKSSLFNALAGRSHALVSDHAGTTRDYLVADIDLDGVKCRLIDTAGLDADRAEMGGASHLSLDHHAASVEIEQAAQIVAGEQRRRAQLEVLCIDGSRPLDAWERGQLAGAGSSGRMVVVTKCDMPRVAELSCAVLETSSATGVGIAALRAEIRRTLLVSPSGGGVVAATALRCFDSLRLAGEALGRAVELGPAGGEELVAAEIHAALVELGKVVGRVYTDDVLDRVFSRFCIGK